MQVRSFSCIGSSLVSLPQIKWEFGRTRGLAHRVVLLLRTNVLGASSVLPSHLVVKLFPSSGQGL